MIETEEGSEGTGEVASGGKKGKQFGEDLE